MRAQIWRNTVVAAWRVKWSDESELARNFRCGSCTPCVVDGGVFFFFSSRRRHTRFDCDWSSDVCSSDLPEAVDHAREPEGDRERPKGLTLFIYAAGLIAMAYLIAAGVRSMPLPEWLSHQIGRAHV